VTLLETEAYGTGQTVVPYRVQTELLGAVRSHVPARPASRQSFSYKWGVAGWGELYMFMFDWSALMTPHKATLDSLRTLSRFVSYRRLSPKFQFSRSAVTLGIYLCVYAVSSFILFWLLFNINCLLIIHYLWYNVVTSKFSN
jgi:hypothetical protein